MAIPKDLEGVLEATPDVLHGAVRFAGTRVFAVQLFDYVLQGASLEEFLADFPGVARAQAEALLGWELSQVRRSFASQPA
jgi:uncharacterized protein (DUF433 family)